MIRPTAKERVLHVLLHPTRADGWVRGVDLLMAGGSRFGARLYELKALGYDHETRRDPTSALPMYRIIVQPQQLTLEQAIAS